MTGIIITLLLVTLAGAGLWALLELGDHDIEDVLEVDQEKHNDKDSNDSGNPGTDLK